MKWACSSAGEHYVDIVGVTSSILVTPTIPFNSLAKSVNGIGKSADVRSDLPSSHNRQAVSFLTPSLAARESRWTAWLWI